MNENRIPNRIDEERTNHKKKKKVKVLNVLKTFKKLA